MVDIFGNLFNGLGAGQFEDQWVVLSRPIVREKAIIANPPTHWAFRRAKLREFVDGNINTLYVRYVPDDETLGQQDYTQAAGWAIRRSPSLGTDSVKWYMDSSSELRGRQNHPAYGMPLTIQYIAVRKEADGDALYARLTDSAVGWDKTPEKTLTIAWKEP